MTTLKIGSVLKWRPIPTFPIDYYRKKRLKNAARDNRRTYDWTLFSPKGLPFAEAYWDSAVAFLADLLPPRILQNPEQWRGINLGTFNGAFQKAWMRRGYPMYGIEIANVIDELHAYGCEGHRDSIFDLSQIADGTFDFAILDRVICLKEFYENFELGLARHDSNAPPPYFSAIRRILKPDGVLIGMLYPWYSSTIIAELASLGGLTLWPKGNGMVAFQLDLALSPTPMPDAQRENLDGPYFCDEQMNGETVKVFLPTNELVLLNHGQRIFEFAAPLRAADAARKVSSNKQWRAYLHTASDAANTNGKLSGLSQIQESQANGVLRRIFRKSRAILSRVFGSRSRGKD